PPIFQHIQEQSSVDWKEMFQVFNMGQRLEFYTSAENAAKILAISNAYNINAKVVGRVEKSKGKSLAITHNGNKYNY
ncbi:MAG: phosphoribosylformylglycinamidine cyclo-ligase, partial [Bacteroidetes bacterium]|nr:phosphoribosylformylglycinamidine cyclo-ligase [Bacteroidota bacterium]